MVMWKKSPQTILSQKNLYKILSAMGEIKKKIKIVSLDQYDTKSLCKEQKNAGQFKR